MYVLDLLSNLLRRVISSLISALRSESIIEIFCYGKYRLQLNNLTTIGEAERISRVLHKRIVLRYPINQLADFFRNRPEIIAISFEFTTLKIIGILSAPSISKHRLLNIAQRIWEKIKYTNWNFLTTWSQPLERRKNCLIRFHRKMEQNNVHTSLIINSSFLKRDADENNSLSILFFCRVRN